MRPVLVATATRLLGSRHPRSVTTVKALRTINNAVTHLPTKQQKLMNQLGDSFGKKVSLEMLESISVGHDRQIRQIQKDVESLWQGSMATATPRFVRHLDCSIFLALAWLVWLRYQ